MTFNEKFKELQRTKGVTVRDVVAALGVGLGTVGGWRKTALPNPAMGRRLADYFGITPNELFDDRIPLPSMYASISNAPTSVREEQAIYSPKNKSKILNHLDIIEKECRALRAELQKY